MLVVMVGVPGSGKSTWARANFRHIVSPDEIRLREFGVRFDPKIEAKVWRRAYTRVAEHLARGDVVCFDATSATRRRRKRLVELAREAGRPAVAICMDTPTDVAWQRNAAREAKVPWPAFQQLVRALKPPAEEEGFAAVIVLPGGEDGEGGTGESSGAPA